jgi:hypothetical protein
VDSRGGVELSLSHEPLARDVNELLISFGIKVNIREREAKLYGVNKKNRFRFNFFTDLEVFTLPRHLERLQKSKLENTSTTQRRNVWYITNIEEIEPVDMQCIQVESSSHMYLIGEALIPTHNSWLLRVAGILYASLVPGLQIYLMRRLHEDVSKNHFEGAGSFPELLSPWVDSGYVQIVYSTPREIRFGNGSKIFAMAAQYEKDKFKMHGQEAGVFLFDEVTHFTETQYQFF